MKWTLFFVSIRPVAYRFVTPDPTYITKILYLQIIIASKCATVQHVCTCIMAINYYNIMSTCHQVLLQHGADPNLQTNIKPKLAPPPSSIPPAEAGSASNLSTAASSTTKLDDFAEATDQVGGGMISPTALGALSALSSVTAQVRETSTYTHEHVVHVLPSMV